MFTAIVMYVSSIIHNTQLAATFRCFTSSDYSTYTKENLGVLEKSEIVLVNKIRLNPYLMLMEAETNIM